jgi:hypothetical protein
VPCVDGGVSLEVEALVEPEPVLALVEELLAVAGAAAAR